MSDAKMLAAAKAMFAWDNASQPHRDWYRMPVEYRMYLLRLAYHALLAAGEKP